MICAKCGTETDEIFDRFGQKLCEDCYLEALRDRKSVV
jgi:NMD protein affecting ribosome stability and mRNA decay